MALNDTLAKLIRYQPMVNIADGLDEKLLDEIGQSVRTGYDIDEESRQQWLKSMTEWLKLAMQLWEQKNYPHENAANIMYPLLTMAALQFSSRAYPNIVKGRDVVKAKVIGEDPEALKAAKAQRVSRHMSWQCTDEMEEWEPNMDCGLTVLPILGCFFKKTWYSNQLRRNVSEFRSPKNIVINYHSKSLETAPRVTDIYSLYPNQIEERKRAGMFLDIDYGMPTSREGEDEDGSTADPRDDSMPHVFLEQHRTWDLDGDGYEEPYIVTLHKDSQKVARIVSRWDTEEIKYNSRIQRIDPVQYFTQYLFMPAADGNIYGSGFGSILGPLNTSINSMINQLTDAGTLRNSQTGFIGKGINMGRGRGGGPVRMKINEWLPVGFAGDDIRKNIFPAPFNEPSSVLFNLLQFMEQAGQKLSVSELLTGDQSVHNEPATTSLMRVEQGLKVFSSIHKRVHRSLKSEFGKLRRLNRIYGDEKKYYTVLDDQQAVYREDYEDESIDIEPVSDPSDITDAQRMGKARLLMEMSGRGLNEDEINVRLLEAANITEPEKLTKKAEQPPDPKIQLERDKLEFEQEKFRYDLENALYEQAKMVSETIYNLARAEAAEVGPQLDQYKMELDVITKGIQAKNANNQGNAPGLAKKPSNSGKVSDSPGTSGSAG